MPDECASMPRDQVAGHGKVGLGNLDDVLAGRVIEAMAAGIARYDVARFGGEVFRVSPRRADPMIVAGVVAREMAPAIERIHDQMPEPKHVIAMGGCASAGARQRPRRRAPRGRAAGG